MQIRLKKAEPSDVEKVRAFAEWTFRAAYEHLNDPEEFGRYCARNFAPDHFRSLFDDPDAAFWLAFSPENELLGYLKINFGKPNDAQNPPENLVGRQSELERIYVHPEKKGLRLGSILIEKAEELARADGSDWLWLGVWERNEAAQKFYEKMGFRVFGRHLFHLGDDPQLDYVLAKRL